MAEEVSLNKPLYKDDGEFQPTPRQPKSSIIGRGAALFVDWMLLRLLFSSIVRFFPDPVLALGPVAPWVGLALGWIYFGVGFSHITLGRTLGKLILRVQVADLKGPDLALGAAFVRSAVLLWPLPVLLALRLAAEHYANVDPTSAFTAIEIFGYMALLGWLFGNLMFAAFDPFGRGVHDRLANSIVINAELEPAPVGEYLAGAREAAAFPPVKKSITSLGVALALCIAFAAASSLEVMRQLKDTPAEEKARMQALLVPGYGHAWPVPPPEDAATTSTVPLNFQTRKRGRLKVEQVKADATTSTLNRVIDATLNSTFADKMQEYLASANMDRMRRGEQPTSAPEYLNFELAFTEYADLFFAAEAHPVYTISQKVDMPTTAVLTTETTGTATAAK